MLSGATDPSQESVDALTQAINDGLDALDLIDVAFTTAPTPTITGTAKYGSTLSVSAGTWVPTPSAVTYQWLRNGVAIPSATGTTYKPLYGDIGAKISVSVTGSRADFITVTKTSAAVTIGKGAFTKQPTPKISGTPLVGRKLTAVVGHVVAEPGGVRVPVVPRGQGDPGCQGEDLHRQVRGPRAQDHRQGDRAQGWLRGYVKDVGVGDDREAVLEHGLRNDLRRAAKVGHTLTAHRGLWIPAASSYSYQW